jgi:hypothetical protein
MKLPNPGKPHHECISRCIEDQKVHPYFHSSSFEVHPFPTIAQSRYICDQEGHRSSILHQGVSYSLDASFVLLVFWPTSKNDPQFYGQVSGARTNGKHEFSFVNCDNEFPQDKLTMAILALEILSVLLVLVECQHTCMCRHRRMHRRIYSHNHCRSRSWPYKHRCCNNSPSFHSGRCRQRKGTSHHSTFLFRKCTPCRPSATLVPYRQR